MSMTCPSFPYPHSLHVEKADVGRLIYLEVNRKEACLPAEIRHIPSHQLVSARSDVLESVSYVSLIFQLIHS